MFYFMRRKRRLRKQRNAASNDEDDEFKKTELADTSLSQRATNGEIPELGYDAEIKQLADDNAVAELKADARFELPGDHAFEKAEDNERKEKADSPVARRYSWSGSERLDREKDGGT